VARGARVLGLLLAGSGILATLLTLPPASGGAGPTFTCFGVQATIVGTVRGDVLRGTNRRDVIAGREGDDAIAGLAGNDLLCGGFGNDRLDGGPGFDRLDGGGGVNTCVNGERRARCRTGPPPPPPPPPPPQPPPPPPTAFCRGVRANIVGTAGDDVLSGTAAPDVIAGLAGNDAIDGLDGWDLLCGDAGDDRLSGGAGRDRVLGGPGTDICLDAELQEECERPEVAFVFAPGVTDGEADLVRRAIELGRRYVRSETGAAAQGFVVFVFANTDDYADRYGSSREQAKLDWECRGADAGIPDQAINVYVKARCGWASMEDPDRYSMIIHEYWHRVQATLAPGPGLRFPIWLLEGSAMFAGSLTVASAGLTDFGADKARKIQASKQVSELRECELDYGRQRPEGDYWCPYQLGFVASDYLGRSSLRPIAAFYRAIGAGADWKAAFQATFGRTVDAFYAEFEQYRRGLAWFWLTTPSSDFTGWDAPLVRSPG
jgi:Ca2+-binding RTX toxin-like protein